MALINCPECNKEVSDSTELCPNCGYSIKKHLQIQPEKEKLKRELNAKLQEVDNQPYPEKPLLSNEKGFYIPFAFLCLFILNLAPFIYFLLSWQDFSWALFIGACFWGIITYVFWKSIKTDFARHLSEYENMINNWDGYKTNAKNELKEHYAALEKILEKYGTIDFNHSPKCPACGSTNVVKISTTKKIVSVELVGLASSNIGKQMECKNCGYKF